MKRKTQQALALSMGALLLLSGCAGTASGNAASSIDNGIVVAGAEPDYLIPGRQGVAFDQMLALFSPLTSVNENGELSYVQAESVESDDATTWTITLRDGWTFHDGEPVTAQSYVDAWNQVAYGPNAWENGWTLEKIVGYGDLNPLEGEPTAERLSGLKVIDDHTFTVELVGPDSQFPLQLGDGGTGFYPMPSSAFSNFDAYNRHPVGNGPFQMASDWEDNKDIVLERFPDYQGEAVSLDQVTYRAYADQSTAYTDVQAGNADLLFVPTEKMGVAESDFGDQFYIFDATGIDFIGFPLWDERYQNKELRQAISMAIDRDAVNDAIFNGLNLPATALTAPGMGGTPVGACGELCEFHPEDAKKLFDEAGGFEGTLEIVYPGGIGVDSLYEAYANQIRQNLDVDAVASPTTDWAEWAEVLHGRTVAGPHHGHWGAVYASQQNVLRSLFTASGLCYDCTGYADPEVDALLDQADAATNIEDSWKYYAQVQELILADFPTVPTFSNRFAYITSDRVDNLVPTVTGTVNVTKIQIKES